MKIEDLTGDIDNDGKMDFLVVDFEGAPVLMHNISKTPHHWITLDLRGKSPNYFAYGTQITMRSGSQVWAEIVSPASSYLSSSDPRVHFGLGSVTTLDSITVRWSNGKVKKLKGVAADQVLRLNE